LAERIIYDGEPGTRWTNDTGKIQYQFVAALINTCGTCLQYHMKIGAWWPIPIHYGCRCEQRAIKPEDKAPHDFINYRELLAKMPRKEQAAAIGASNYRLLKAGVVEWKDVVTPSRVRDFREVVAKKKLSVATMEKAGVGPRWAAEAHAAVHTPEHEAIARQRRELIERLKGAGMSQERLVSELSQRLAERVAIGAGAGIAGKDTILSTATRGKFGADLKIVGWISLTEHEKRWPKVLIRARSNTMAVLDDPTFLDRDGGHHPVVLRYVVLVEPRTGRLETLVWRVDVDPAGEYQGAVGPMEWLAPNMMGSCLLHHAAARFALGLPEPRSLALLSLPPGHTQIPIPDALHEVLGLFRFTPEQARKMEKGLRNLVFPTRSG